MVIGIPHLAINTKDMNTSLDFYIRVLGFKRAFTIMHPETNAPWIEYVQAGTQLVELFYGPKEDNPYKHNLCGLNHLCFQVEDIDIAVNRIKEAEYPLNTQIEEDRELNRKVWLKDPNGIRIELMQIHPTSPLGKTLGL